MYVYKASELSLIAAVRKAIAEDRLAINVGSKSNAVAMRAQFYAFRKKLKKVAAEDVTTLEVVGELDQVTLSVTDEGTIVLQREDATPGMVAMKAALEAAGVTIRDPNMEAYEASQRRLVEKLAKPEASDEGGPVAGGPRVTPYYTRDK